MSSSQSEHTMNGVSLLGQMLNFRCQVIKRWRYWRRGWGSRGGVVGLWVRGCLGHKLIFSLLGSLSLWLYQFLLIKYQTGRIVSDIVCCHCYCCIAWSKTLITVALNLWQSCKSPKKSETHKTSPQDHYNHSCNLTPNQDSHEAFTSSVKQKVKWGT